MKKTPQLPRPRHRPRGLASRCILIFPRTDHVGYLVHIGIDVYERLGSPRHVDIESRPGGWRLIPTVSGGYAVLTLTHNTPRFPLNATRHAELNLGTGHYPAIVLDGALIF